MTDKFSWEEEFRIVSNELARLTKKIDALECAYSATETRVSALWKDSTKGAKTSIPVPAGSRITKMVLDLCVDSPRDYSDD